MRIENGLSKIAFVLGIWAFLSACEQTKSLEYYEQYPEEARENR